MKKLIFSTLISFISISAIAQPGSKDTKTKKSTEKPPHPPPTESTRWIITPLPAMTAGIGRISIIIPQDTTINLPNGPVTLPLNVRDTFRIKEPPNNSYLITDLPKYMPTKDYYSVSLNGIWFSVPVRSGQDTRIKAGYLLITKKVTEGSSTQNPLSDAFEHLYGSSDFPDETWTWKLNLSVAQFTGKKEAIFALPPGEYWLYKIRDSDHKNISYKVIIKDGEWVRNGVKVEE